MLDHTKGPTDRNGTREADRESIAPRHLLARAVSVQPAAAATPRYIGLGRVSQAGAVIGCSIAHQFACGQRLAVVRQYGVSCMPLCRVVCPFEPI